MPSKIDTVSSRAALKPRRGPYFQKLRSGCHLGYRKMTATSIGTWVARFGDTNSGYQEKSLGTLEVFPAHKHFDEACKLAFKWFDHRAGGGAAQTVTVREACERYIQKLKADGLTAAAADALGRFKRYVYPQPKLADSAVDKLTSAQLADWRAFLSTTPAILQNKSKKATKLRAKSSVNREMASLKAALNQTVRDGFVSTDAAWAYSLVPFKNATGRRACYLDAAMRKALIDNAEPDLAVLIRALCWVPTRPGAMAALTAGQWEGSQSVLAIGKDKANGHRRIQLPVGAAAFFQGLAANKDSAAPLISRANGGFWTKDAWKKPFKKAVTVAGLPESGVMYSLRHSAITDLISLHNVDLLTVAELSGTSIQMIQKHYGHLLQEQAKKGIEALTL